MRVIGVVDLLGGRAVHARAGARAGYRPVQDVAGLAIEPGDAPALARRYQSLGVSDMYAADLDAIASPDAQTLPHTDLVAALVELSRELWLDAGVTSADHARLIAALGVARVVVGLETLSSWSVLEDICRATGPDRVAFSLDLRNGRPVLRDGGIRPGETADRLATRAARAGAGAIIVLELARVGTGLGPDVELVTRVRAAAPGTVLLAGGGIRGSRDLKRLAEAGCDGVLAATALHDGRLGRDEVASAAAYRNETR
jgi:phosphoribosylformimino-5-aminoimidazole carboxamide ribotide isomerase